jgi:protein gp37
MAQNTEIAWTDHTLNCWIGCTEVSPACDHCYACIMAHRYGWAEWVSHPRHRTAHSTWRQAHRWNRLAMADGEAHRVFSCSLADFLTTKSPPNRGATRGGCLDWLLPNNMNRYSGRGAQHIRKPEGAP